MDNTCPFFSECPLGQSCKNVKLGEFGNYETAEIMIVKSVPDKVCDTQNNLFAETADLEILQRYMQLSGILEDPTKVFMSSLIRCGVDKKNKTLVSSKNLRIAKTHCSYHMEQTMARMKNLKVIVPLGGEARDYFCEDKLSMTKSQGRQYKKDYGFGEVSVIPNFSPVMVYMNPDRHGQKYKSVFDKIGRVMQGDTKGASFKKKYLSLFQFRDYAERLKKYYAEGKIQDVAYDIESSTAYGDSNSLTAMAHDNSEYVTGFSIADEIEETGYYINLFHPRMAEKRGKELSKTEFEETWKILKEILETIPIYCHNAKFDLLWSFVKLHIDPNKLRLCDDTFALSFLLFGAKRDTGQALGLKDLCKLMFQIDEDWDEAIEIELSKFNRIKDRRLTNIPFEVLANYGSMDAIAMLFLRRRLKEILSKPENSKIQEPYGWLLRAIKIFAQIESNKIPINMNVLDYLETNYKKRVTDSRNRLNNLPITKAYFEAVYKRDNPDWDEPSLRLFVEESEMKVRGNMIKDFVFNFMKCPVHTETDTGQPSLDKAARLKLVKTAPEEYQREAVALLTESLEVADQISKYINQIRAQVDQFGGFYPDYNLCSVTTGRLSGMLHTYPSFGDMKYNFVSHWVDEGGLVFAPDYSQVEVRAFASLSGDENLKQAYLDNLDIHKFVASRSFNVEYEDVTKLQRGRAKAVIFGMLYGQSYYTLAENLGITEEEALEIQNAVFDRFPKIRKFIDATIEFGEKNGYVESALGRKRMLEALKLYKYTKDKLERKRYNAAVRAAQNHPIQSTASDVTLTSIVEMHDRIRTSGRKSKFLGTVHDSIELSVHPSEVVWITKVIKEVCEDDLKTRFDWLNGVPYRMDIEMGVSWGNCVDMEIIKYEGEGGTFELSGRDMGIDSVLKSFNKNKYFDAYWKEHERIEEPPELDDKRVFNGIIYPMSTHKVKGELTLVRTNYNE